MAGQSRCARPGCGGVAAAWLSYDYAGQRVWLDDPGADTPGHHSALCAAHAGRLRPPRGWSCHDRRSGLGVASPPPPRPVAATEPAAAAVAGAGVVDPAGQAPRPAGPPQALAV